MPPEPRRHLAGLSPAYHGSIGAAEAAAHGFRPVEILDFSVSTNPLGPSPLVRAALSEVDPSRYPDDRAADLCAALAAREGLPADCVLAGNGSSELIWLTALAYLDPGDRALIVGPTYGEYERAVRQAAADPIAWRADPRTGFAVDREAVIAAAVHAGVKLLFLGNPNNPTGVLLPREELAQLAAALPDTLVAIDEAYLPFVPDAASTAGLVGFPNILLIRSLTKDGGLAGLRLGYALAGPSIIRALAALRPPWSVSSAAQAAGLAALRDEGHRRRGLDEVARAKALLEDGFGGLGLPVTAGAANFLLVRVGDGARFRDRLLRRGICVRDCASFGLPEFVRVGVRPVAECRRLIAAVTDLTPVARA